MITCYQFLIVYHRWIKTLRQEGGGKPHPWQIRVLSNLSVIIVISFCNHFHYSTDNYLQSHCNHHHRYHHGLYRTRSRTNEDISRIMAEQYLTREQKVRRGGGEQGRVPSLPCPNHSIVLVAIVVTIIFVITLISIIIIAVSIITRVDEIIIAFINIISIFDITITTWTVVVSPL